MPSVLHLHIPRTAGSSLNRALERYGKVYAFTSLPHFFKDNFDGTVGGSQFISGHFCFGLHEYFSDPIYFVVLRDPVARVKSLYRYIRQNRQHPLNRVFRQTDFSLDQVFQHPPQEVGIQFFNGQVRQLNYFHRSGLANLTREHLQFALGVLERQDVIVATLDGLHTKLRTLADRIGIPMQDIPITNCSDQEAQTSDDCDELICKHNALDLELYNKARELAAS